MTIDVVPTVAVTIRDAGTLTDAEISRLTAAVESLARRCLLREAAGFKRMKRTLNLAVAALYK